MIFPRLDGTTGHNIKNVRRAAAGNYPAKKDPKQKKPA